MDKPTLIQLINQHGYASLIAASKGADKTCPEAIAGAMILKMRAEQRAYEASIKEPV